MLSKVKKCSSSSFNGNPKNQKSLDLFKLPGSNYVKPGLLTKTKDQLADKPKPKISTEKQKPSCSLFAPQPKRVFAQNYYWAIPKHLRLPNNKVKPPPQNVFKRKPIVRRPSVPQIDICAIIEKDMLKSKQNTTKDKPKNETETISSKNCDPLEKDEGSLVQRSDRKIETDSNKVCGQKKDIKICDPIKKDEELLVQQNDKPKEITTQSIKPTETMETWIQKTTQEFTNVSGIPREMKQPPLSLQDRARLRGIQLHQQISQKIGTNEQSRKRPRSPSFDRRQDHKHIKLSPKQSPTAPSQNNLDIQSGEEKSFKRKLDNPMDDIATQYNTNKRQRI